MIITLQLLASLSLLVLIHEFGHFSFARLFHIRVEKFYIFFDIRFALFRYRPRGSETEYGIGWLPLGGYTKIAGMIDESLDTRQLETKPQPWEFRSRPAWQRLLVMAGGVLFNFLTAMVIYIGLSHHYGDHYLPVERVGTGMQFSEVAHEAGFRDGDILQSADGEKIVAFDEDNVRKIFNAKEVTVLRDGKPVVIYMPTDFVQQLMASKKGFASYRVPFVVDSVMSASPALAAGLMANDTIVKVNGRDMFADDVFITIRNNAGKEIGLGVKRGADTLALKVTPNENGQIGILVKGYAKLYQVEHAEYTLLQSVPVGLKKGWRTLTGYVSDMKYVFTPEGATSVGGFGTIAQMFPSSFNWQTFWERTAFISVILAVMNLLPIPALDGGHILFLLVEIVTGRKPSQKFLLNAQMIGMAFLLFLFFYANVADLFRFLMG